MPTFLTMPQIANRALATLYNNTVLAGLVHRNYDPAFAGKQGDTVNVRVPIVFSANEFNRATGIVLQNPAEDTFPVVLDKIADVSFAVTSEDMTLVIDDFAERLLNPAMEAINQKVDADLATELASAATQVADPTGDYVEQQAGGGVVTTPDTDHPSKVLIPARVRLGRAKMPTLNRYAIFSPEAAGEIIGDPTMHEADKRGNTDGLVEAAIGRKFGFDSYENNVLGEGADAAEPGRAVTGAAATDVFTSTGHGLDAGEPVRFSATTGGAGLSAGTTYYVLSSGLTANAFKVSATQGGTALDITTDMTAGTVRRHVDGVAFHRDAITLASRTLEKPLGKVGAQAAISNYGGLGLRVVYDYDITYKQTVISVDFLYGVRAVRPQGAVVLSVPSS